MAQPDPGLGPKPISPNPKKAIASNIVILGLVSFFTDIGTQMIYPILPLYLTAVLGASPAVIGVIEGVAESLASVLRLFSGIVADKYNNKKQLAFIGYFGSFVSKILIIFSTTWGGVLLARVTDRFGKGLRTAPRDALIAESTQKSGLGKSFGLHKALDMMGTAAGILLAYFLLAAPEGGYRNIFICSMIPALIGPLVVLLVKDSKKPIAKKLNFGWKAFDGRLKLFLLITFVFTLGNSSNAFLLLRAYSAGFSARETVLLYFVYSLVAALLSYHVGKWSDRAGRRYTLPIGYILYGLVYLGIGLLSSRPAFYGLFVVYGFYVAIATGGERALLAEIAPERLKASAFGLHSAIVGIGLLPASVIAGFFWDCWGEAAPFIFGGALGLLAGISVFLLLGLKNAPASAKS
ncbi:MAG: MFS transporter [Chitinispirillales bacterium]|jgi:MFS family permease|nr:MFS transporter [Chitinispirillales bacterium]